VIQTRPRVQDDQGEAQGHGVAIDSQLRTDQVEKYAGAVDFDVRDRPLQTHPRPDSE
jgi:hypothetical protein